MSDEHHVAASVTSDDAGSARPDIVNGFVSAQDPSTALAETDGRAHGGARPTPLVQGNHLGASTATSSADRVAPPVSLQRRRRPASLAQVEHRTASPADAVNNVWSASAGTELHAPDNSRTAPADTSPPTVGMSALDDRTAVHSDDVALPTDSPDNSTDGVSATVANAEPLPPIDVTAISACQEDATHESPAVAPQTTDAMPTTSTNNYVSEQTSTVDAAIASGAPHASCRNSTPADASWDYVPYIPYRATEGTVTIAQLAARMAPQTSAVPDGGSNGSATAGISVFEAQRVSPAEPGTPEGGAALAPATQVDQPVVLDVPYTAPGGYQEASTAVSLPDAADADIVPYSAVAPPAVPPTNTDISASAPPPPPAGSEEEEGGTMTIIEHLEELRVRLMWCLGAIGLGAFAGWFLVPGAIEAMQAPLIAHGVPMVMLTAFGPFVLNIKLAFIFGTVLASPILLYQIWGFIAPGLTRNEKTYARPFVLLGSLLFVAGAATGFYIFPLGIAFALTFFPALHVTALIEADKYVSFIGWIMLVFGVTYELPVFLVFLSLIGVITSQGLAQRRKAAFVIIFIVATVITPGADFISPIIMGIILCTLYESSIWLARAVGR